MRTKAIVLILALIGGLAFRSDAAEGRISGYMFGDYYYNVSGPAEKQNGFQFRRIYFTYDLKWSDKISGRFRLESNDAGFGKKDKMIPYVKESSITWKQDQGALSAGLAPTLTWALQEKVWGYRPIEKTVMDLRGKGSAVDLGVMWMRKLGGSSSLSVMLSNGNGTAAETDNDKKIAVQGLTKLGGMDAKVYADMQTQKGGAGQTTLAGFVGKQGEGFHGGAEVFYRIDKKAAAGEDQQGFGVSLFGAKPVGEGKKVFARADLYEPNSDAEDDQETLLIGGLDWALAKDLHLMPNVLVTLYQDSGKDTQIVPRVTGFFEF
ncbi:MAG: hypothetical protein HYW07_14995 [Candidatus Latescibacteria bacterium]|nr:hypothetical protein [Candidatus Latescibacterota bacterium]